KVEEEQLKRLDDVKRRRNWTAVRTSLHDLKTACQKGDNVMPRCIEAVKNMATIQEICDVYREVYGEYRDPGLF
ncbi:MAG: methylmalonyl-CoA mutase family protein, partial [Smithellaceae bacterium]|nr:methylmalonyl-CoA mutase family protein [Smithellaceae bacterium]